MATSSRTTHKWPWRRHLLALALIYSRQLPQVHSEAALTPSICVDAASDLLSSLAVDQPSRYSAATCDVAPVTTVCEITGTPGPCAAVPDCQTLSTRVDGSCTPTNEAGACCTTFRALPCVGCTPIPLACLQFCFDEPTTSAVPPADPANATLPVAADTPPPPPPPPPPPAAAAPSEEEEGDEGLADPEAAPATLGTADSASNEDEPLLTTSGPSERTPTGMPRQIIVESISAAAPAPHGLWLAIAVSTVSTTAAALVCGSL